MRLLVVLLPLLALPLQARAAEGSAAADAFIARARDLKLAEDVQWLRLVHYRKATFGGYRSQADGFDFFLSPEGVINPQAELEATVRGLFGLVPLTPDQVARNVLPAFCRFPARAAWLLGKLQIPFDQLPAQECPKLDDFWKRVQPESVTLVFSTYYLNNPASAYGHTFLRIHKSGTATSEERELLDYGVDFSATADTGNAFLFATKSIFGLFPGFFHIFPYYYKVREYNDYESRDLWEYDLNLTPAQVAMLVAHIYEMGSTHFDYYYMDENCAYQVLALLEAAAPELNLLAETKIPVIPSDTVKALFTAKGLVKRTTYRPSAATQFRARTEGMSRAQLDAVESLALDAETPLPAAEPIRVLEAAADLIDVRYAKELPFKSDGPAGKLKRRVLERRAALLNPSPPLVVPPPVEKRPDMGHGAARFSLGSGWSSARGQMMTASWRLSLHDLADPPAGYPELAQIEFFPTQLRVYPELQTAQLESVDLVNATSLHAVNAFDHALSWRLRVGARRLRDGGCDNCLAGSLELGSGFAVNLLRDRVTLFAFGDTSVDAAKHLRGLEPLPQLRVGVGPWAGARVRLGENGVFMASGGFRWYPFALEQTGWQLESSLRWSAGSTVALGFDARKYPQSHELGASVYFYY